MPRKHRLRIVPTQNFGVGLDTLSSSDIIDDIYEAALFPDRWSQVLANAGGRLGFWGGAITWGKGKTRPGCTRPTFKN